MTHCFVVAATGPSAVLEFAGLDLTRRLVSLFSSLPAIDSVRRIERRQLRDLEAAGAPLGQQVLIVEGDALCSKESAMGLLRQAHGSDTGTHISFGMHGEVAAVYVPEFSNARVTNALDDTLGLKVGEHHFQSTVARIDSPGGMQQHVTVMLAESGKPSDGVVAKHLNRRLSRHISRLMIALNVVPSTMSLASFVIGVCGSMLIALGYGYWTVAAGGMLFQLAAVTDKCDGEIARVTLRESANGAWLDTLLDNLTYLVFVVCLLVSQREHGVLAMAMGSVIIISTSASIGVMVYYVRNYTATGSVTAFHQALGAFEERGMLGPLFRLRFIFRRDFFSLLVLVFAMADAIYGLFWLASVLCSVMLLFVLYSFHALRCESPRQAA